MMSLDPIVYASLSAGVFLTLWGTVVRNTGGYGSLILVKIVPALIGIWCLFECARVMT